MPETIVNIAGYKFADAMASADLPVLRADLRERAAALSLRGTILLAPEGINIFLAGSRGSVDAILMHLRSLPGLADLVVKESLSGVQPFAKLLVKLKREIIPFGQPDISPAKYTSRRLSASDLKAWLDAGQQVTLLDTRNDYELEHGSFTSAVKLPLNDFRSFPARVAELPEEMKSRPVVTFCTGGIRCEKAAPYLESVGFREVYQLEGGILKYFEEVGAAHYEGACFVFDDRVALDPDLRPVLPTPEKKWSVEAGSISAGSDVDR